MVQFDKIDEVADRLRDFEQQGKPRYFNLMYVNGSHEKPQPVGGDRQTGAKKFKDQVYAILNSKNADKIIVQEFSQKSTNVKKPAHEVEILIDRDFYPMRQEAYPVEVSNKKEQNPEPPALNGLSSKEMLGRLDEMKQDIRSEVAREFQLIKEQEERERIKKENDELKKENRELKTTNDTLLDKNEELFAEVEKLQKYIPDNYKIGNLSLTKTLGSILGTATETLVKNIVVKKPEKIRSLLGNEAFSQLAGIIEEDPEEAEETSQLEKLEPLEPVSPEETQKQKIAEAIHELNQRITNDELNKIQLMYAFILNEDETINLQKLNKLMRFISLQHQEEYNHSKEDEQGMVEKELE